MHSSAKLMASAALTCAGSVLASMTVIPFELENHRDREVIVHIGYFYTEAEARQANVGESAKADLSISRIHLKAGEKTRTMGGAWVKWCQVSPPSSLPCEVWDLRKAGAIVVLE
jgi:hypothetical protein